MILVLTFFHVLIINLFFSKRQDVVHGYPDYLKITVMVALYNPSDITIGAGNINFNALFQGETTEGEATTQISSFLTCPPLSLSYLLLDNLIGKALINDIVLVSYVQNS